MVKGAVGLKEEPLYEVDSIQRAINQVRGIHPPPIMNIDGQQFPLVVEGSPRSPRLMMEDCGEHMRLYLEVSGAAVQNVWALPGPNIVFRGRIIPLEWTGPAEELDPLMTGAIKVNKQLLVRAPWRSLWPTLARCHRRPKKPRRCAGVRNQF